MEAAQRTLDWLCANGGHVAPDTELVTDPTFGLSVYATAPLPADTRLVSCPFSLAITPEFASAAVVSLLSLPRGEDALVFPPEHARAGEKWSGRMMIGAYVGLHWVYAQDKGVDGSDLPKELQHWTYIDSLPPTEQLLTPLYFSEEEMVCLQGTNLHGAVGDRRREWEDESEVVRSVLGVEALTWARYFASSTYLSSRAFPSKLLSLPSEGSTSTTAVRTSATEASHPVLLPGVDLFNHARGQPIVWLSSSTPSASASASASSTISALTPESTTPTVSLLSTQPQTPGQLFNNYGPKPNEELLIGYGFVLPSNPDDTVALKLGFGPNGLAQPAQAALTAAGLRADERFEVRRDGKLDARLMHVLRIVLSGGKSEARDEVDDEGVHAQHEDEVRGLELEADVLGMLGEMMEGKLAKLQEGGRAQEGVKGGVRDEVRRMCAEYRRGQVDILTTALEGVTQRLERIDGLMDQGMGECACCS